MVHAYSRCRAPKRRSQRTAAAQLAIGGYSLEETQELADNFADSEFVCQNGNPRLRTIDSREVDLKLMYYPDGTMVTDAIQ